MATSIARNKLEARRIESWVQREMANRGISNIAKEAGVNKSTVTRWRNSVVPISAILFSILFSDRPMPKGDFEA